MIVRKYTGAKPHSILPKGAIDTQLHTYEKGFPALPGGPDLPDGTPSIEDYQHVMKWLGIERFVLTQGNAHQNDNANLLAGLAKVGDLARGVAVIDGATTDDEMSKLSDAGVVGARIMDLPGGAVGLDQLEDIEARANAAGWMLAIQFNGSDILDHADRLSQLRANWVFDHHGKFFRGADPKGPEVDKTKELIDSGNCWFKFAGCYESSRVGAPDYGDVAAVSKEIAQYAPERIVWGSNFPHNGATSSEAYPDDAILLDTVLSWFPDENCRRLALLENPEHLFKF